MKSWSDVDVPWAEEVGKALGFTNDTPLLGMEQDGDYQGYCSFVALTGQNKVVVYAWDYGSCSGCDVWMGNECITESEVKAGAQTMTIEQYRRYALAILTDLENVDKTTWKVNHEAVESLNAMGYE